LTRSFPNVLTLLREV